METAEILTTLTAAILGGVIGGALQGLPALLVPAREARLNHQAWILNERRVLYAKVAREAHLTLAWIQDFERRNAPGNVDPYGSFDESRGIHMSSPQERLEITAELHVLASSRVLTTWRMYDLAADQIRRDFVWASEDEGKAVSEHLPILNDAANLLLQDLENVAVQRPIRMTMKYPDGTTKDLTGPDRPGTGE